MTQTFQKIQKLKEVNYRDPLRRKVTVERVWKLELSYDPNGDPKVTGDLYCEFDKGEYFASILSVVDGEDLESVKDDNDTRAIPQYIRNWVAKTEDKFYSDNEEN